ncbi:hypothetical protein SM0020_10950 [Sinorhizobium meliloti CCNWSX0020]|uniref:Uncharacterized protein n=1 Tax=Sinorhizobium meliloti CCNWSX0020 TaxID=1107881 RepID=H0FYB4_RHIML|nr:hypothetical protein [Sinorhizobium meliloti]EHK77968.1 hypothetical protein SM0020_10950 [Sinorhizobium meliloti CCNWSX0020]PII37624.1 hypothetical protein T190_31645 [Sinorhizobium meliloti CCBAU 01290]RVG73137.1 hypothetical protein CN220_08895 [Sinorhizobium meliloti]
MNPSRKLKIASLAMVVGMFGLEAGERVSFPGVSGFVSSAEARVGRPLTPVSVAGVARRTTRRVVRRTVVRCANGVYNC